MDDPGPRRPGLWLLFGVVLVAWVLSAVLIAVWPIARASSTPTPSTAPGVLVVTTANIRKDLGPAAARADLVRAATGSDVVLAQEMGRRRLDLRGWSRAQATRGVCSETPVYWRTAALARVSWRTVVLQRGTWPGATRCATLVQFRELATGRVFVVINVHQAQHVEKAGHPRPGRAAVYARGMARLDRVRHQLHVPYLIGGDWNVDVRADARVRWHGFPRSYLSGLRVTRTGGTLGRRQVDYIWTGPAWRPTSPTRRVTRTHSDHNFVRVQLVWAWTC